MKTTLLAVCGLSPQVITETLYALHQNGSRVDAIRVLTTRKAKDLCVAGLFGAGDGHFLQYQKEYPELAKGIDFAPIHIEAVRNKCHPELNDIAEGSDNEIFLKACLEKAFELTCSAEQRVFFSIAGGRKTMGACLTLAAQFYGRPIDRVFHVLVSPEFESNRDFYYPPSEPRQICLKDLNGQEYWKSTKYAKISLITMPFISIRDRIQENYLKKPEEPGALLAALIKDNPPELTVDLRLGKIIYKSIEMDLMPARLALYCFFALIKKNADCQKETCRDCTDCFLELPAILNSQEKINNIYRSLYKSHIREEMSSTGISSLSSENFASYKSRIRQDLNKHFGPYVLPELEISSQGKRPNTRYGIKMDRRHIKVIL